MSACICDWPPDCGGTGTLQCGGCGGDLCVCRCGGEMPCDGCSECAEDPWAEDDPDRNIITGEYKDP